MISRMLPTLGPPLLDPPNAQQYFEIYVPVYIVVEVPDGVPVNLAGPTDPFLLGSHANVIFVCLVWPSVVEPPYAITTLPSLSTEKVVSAVPAG